MQIQRKPVDHPAIMQIDYGNWLFVLRLGGFRTLKKEKKTFGLVKVLIAAIVVDKIVVKIVRQRVLVLLLSQEKMSACGKFGINYSSNVCLAPIRIQSACECVALLPHNNQLEFAF